MAFLAAGHEASALAVGWSLYELSLDPKRQTKSFEPAIARFRHSNRSRSKRSPGISRGHCAGNSSQMGTCPQIDAHILSCHDCLQLCRAKGHHLGDQQLFHEQNAGELRPRRSGIQARAVVGQQRSQGIWWFQGQVQLCHLLSRSAKLHWPEIRILRSARLPRWTRWRLRVVICRQGGFD